MVYRWWNKCNVSPALNATYLLTIVDCLVQFPDNSIICTRLTANNSLEIHASTLHAFSNICKPVVSLITTASLDNICGICGCSLNGV